MLNIEKFNKLKPNVKEMLIEIENNINNEIPFTRIDIANKYSIPYNSLSNYYHKYIENKHLYKKHNTEHSKLMVNDNDNELLAFSVIAERLNLHTSEVNEIYYIALAKMNKYCKNSNMDIIEFLEGISDV